MITLALLAGYLWLIYSLYTDSGAGTVETGVCLFKELTTVPCPSCGSTRSVKSLVRGDVWNAFYWNPFGIIISLTMILLPFWLIFDLIAKKNTFYIFYIGLEKFLKNKWIAAAAIILVLANWIWNITKGL